MSFDMELHQKVSVASSWNVQGPYDINSILQSQCDDDSSHPPQPVTTHSIKLAPPPSAANDDDNSPPCQLVLSCLSGTAVRSVKVISNARHVELYDNLDSYCCTVRGERWEEEEGDQQMDSFLYAARLNVETPAHRCRLKFVSLTDKRQLTLSQLMVTSTRTESEPYATGVGGVGGRGIDMVKVREIMASLQQPIPSNVQSLMQTVEQYQKNQASVLDDFQQAATARLSASSSNDPKASLASNMAGMLSAFSKASSYQQAASTRAATRRSHAVAPNKAVESDNQLHTGVDNEGNSQVGDCSSQQFNVDSLSKLMTSLGVRRAPEGVENVDTDGFDDSRDMLSALRTMCRDVSHMRAADRHAAERSYGPERREHDSNAEIARQTDKHPIGNGMVDLEKRLMGYVAATEERIMGRLDRQIELLRDHIDLRFNKLEAMLQGSGSDASETAAIKCDGPISEDLD